MNNNPPNSKYWISKIQVKFPLPPYNNQMSLMANMINALHNSKNCLIESPTGTGKTLALLCASLAWLDYYKSNNSNNKHETQPISDDDFEEKNVKKNKKPAENEDEMPRIIYCSRTHKQIDQVVEELKRTAYNNHNLKMSILGSRKILCTNDEVKKEATLNEICRHKTKKNTPFAEKCPKFLNVSNSDTFSKIITNPSSPAFSRHYLIEQCEDLDSCAYYTSQRLSEKADIIFAPYNYILDPLIRNQMEICAEKAVIILDEAHNIENICRAALCANFSSSFLNNLFKELSMINSLIYDENTYAKLKEAFFVVNGFIAGVNTWIKEQEETLKQKTVTVLESIYSGENFLGLFSQFSLIKKEQFAKIKASYHRINDISNQDDLDFLPYLSEASSKMLSSLILIFEHIFGGFADCFTVAITKGSYSDLETNSQSFLSNANENSAHFAISDLVLRFICLTPSIAFAPLAKECRSIILASGTLAPINSFESELGVPFDYKFEASNHIKPEQALICALGVGTDDKNLRITFSNADGLNLQDQIGYVLLHLAEVVPKGLLVFFPSYNIIEKMTKRWRSLKILERIKKFKSFHTESRGMSSEEVDEMLRSYYFNACCTDQGAILFAVCRGRISEGMDFKDNRARAVVTIGIPYSNLKTLDVEKKMWYNDKVCQNSGKSGNYLSGREWYNIQAYRALNQALGRCVRHKDDWGAIIMIDDRFCVNNYTSNAYLSKWIHRNLKSFMKFSSFTNDIKSFFTSKAHLINDTQEDENIYKDFNSKAYNAKKFKKYAAVKRSFSKKFKDPSLKTFFNELD